MGDRRKKLPDDAVAALVHHILRRHGPCDVPGIMEHLGWRSRAKLSRICRCLLTRSDLFVQAGGDLYFLASATTASPVAPLPTDVERSVHGLLLQDALSTRVLQERLEDAGWLVKRAQIVRHLAHFDDFVLDSGRWALTDRKSSSRFVSLSGPSHRRALSATGERSREIRDEVNALVASVMGEVEPSRPARAGRRDGSLGAGDVLITAKGGVYHLDDDCLLLRLGWAKAYEEGSGPTGLRAATYDEARRLGRRACSGCGR